jgi:adenine-specific DNA-methyltransferase
MNGKKKSLLEIATSYSEIASAEKNISEKKKIGQFFTPSNIALFMARMSNVSSNHIKILDPGAGTGTLSAALLDEILINDTCSKIELVLFEKDKTLLPYLVDLMGHAEMIFSSQNIAFTYSIINEDFIIYHKDIVSKRVSESYDIILSNPPYFKVSKKHRYSTILSEYIHGQPNVYFMFMIISAKLLKENGQLIFITPRSYCSGSYFKKFRSFFFNKIDPIHFHLFTTRSKIFTAEKVKQEIVIINGIKRNFSSKFTTISSSSADPFVNYSEKSFNKKFIYYVRNNELLIRLPLTNEHENIINKFEKWSNNITKMDIGISTGPVVPYRANHLLETYEKNKNYPLFYMKHIRNGKLCFPIGNTDLGIKDSIKSNSILIPSGNYIFIKRFSSSEQKRRIECCLFDKREHNYTYLGIENHLNYLYKKQGEFIKEELYGLFVFLNSKLLDEYFRIMNGNTQVNAYDINLLPLPDKEEILSLGKNYLLNKKI